MDSADGPSSKLQRLSTNYDLCLVCQLHSHESLVSIPTKYEKLVESIQNRAKYGDRNFPEIQRRLQSESLETLKSSKATWHRSCYQDVTHKEKCERARIKYEAAVSSKSTSIAPHSLSSSSFRRSHSAGYDKNLCFFC